MTPDRSDDSCLDPDDVAAFLTARLEPASMGMLERHVAVCSTCRELLSGLAPGENASAHKANSGWTAFAPTTPFYNDSRPPVAPGTHVGRYIVSTRLGLGAMGE